MAATQPPDTLNKLINDLKNDLKSKYVSAIQTKQRRGAIVGLKHTRYAVDFAS
jgi:hypothetical protein